MTRIASIADITPRAGAWPNILDATIPGAPNVHVARVIASHGDREERIAIVFPQPAQPVDRAAVLSAVRAQLADFSVAYVMNNQVGLVHLWVDDASPSEVVFLAAAAAAKLQHSWGWDESPSIKVSVGDQSFCFQVQHSGERSHEVLELTAA
jgi:hypothetical protein